MVSRVEVLYELQMIDTRMDEEREALSCVENQLDQDEELLSARRKLAEEEESLRKSRGKLRTLELDLEEISDKIAAAQDMLYGGTVTNPKELASLQQEMEYLQRRQSEVEDSTLELMTEVEEKESRLETAGQRLQRMEKEWEAKQDDLHRQAKELRALIASLMQEREEILRGVSKEDLTVYDDLRRRKGGQAVALLEGGVCQGCRVALPTSLVQKVRRGHDLVYCGSCQRIMYSLS